MQLNESNVTKGSNETKSIRNETKAKAMKRKQNQPNKPQRKETKAKPAKAIKRK
jgi:hypothetical protein